MLQPQEQNLLEKKKKKKKKTIIQWVTGWADSVVIGEVKLIPSHRDLCYREKKAADAIVIGDELETAELEHCSRLLHLSDLLLLHLALYSFCLSPLQLNVLSVHVL